MKCEIIQNIIDSEKRVAFVLSTAHKITQYVRNPIMLMKFLHRRIVMIMQGILIKARMVSSTNNLWTGNNIGEEFIFLEHHCESLFSPGYLAYMDVGANLGEHFLKTQKAFSKHVEISTAFLVEPIPTFADELEQKFSSTKGVQILRVALGLRSGETSLIYEVGDGGRSFGIPVKKTGGSKRIVEHLIPTFSGDSIIQTQGVHVDFVKLDVDGKEFDVIRGFSDTLRTQHPVLMWEYTYDFSIENGVLLSSIIEFLKIKQYTTWVIDEEGVPQKVRLFNWEVIRGQTKNFLSLSNGMHKK